MLFSRYSIIWYNRSNNQLFCISFYWRLTNYHKCRGLKPHTFMIPVSIAQESGCGSAGSSAYQLCYILIRGWVGKTSTLTFPQPGMTSGGIYFLAAVQLTACCFFKASRRVSHIRESSSPTFKDFYLIKSGLVRQSPL